MALNANKRGFIAKEYVTWWWIGRWSKVRWLQERVDCEEQKCVKCAGVRFSFLCAGRKGSARGDVCRAATLGWKEAVVGYNVVICQPSFPVLPLLWLTTSRSGSTTRRVSWLKHAVGREVRIREEFYWKVTTHERRKTNFARKIAKILGAMSTEESYPNSSIIHKYGLQSTYQRLTQIWLKIWLTKACAHGSTKCTSFGDVCSRRL